MLSFGGKLGVNCFVLITGYFMVHGHLKVQSLLRVMLQTWFYSFAILAISAIAQPDLVTPERLREAVTPITSGEYWFITCYLALMVASPFLNVLYRNLGDSGRRSLMVIGFVVLSAIPTITTYNPIGSDLVWFFYLYLMGGWLRDRPLWKRRGNACALVAGMLFVWASMAAIGWAQRAFGFDYVMPDYFIWQYMVPTFGRVARPFQPVCRVENAAHPLGEHRGERSTRRLPHPRQPHHARLAVAASGMGVRPGAGSDPGRRRAVGCRDIRRGHGHRPRKNSAFGTTRDEVDQRTLGSFDARSGCDIELHSAAQFAPAMLKTSSLTSEILTAVAANTLLARLSNGATFYVGRAFQGHAISCCMINLSVSHPINCSAPVPEL